MIIVKRAKLEMEKKIFRKIQTSSGFIGSMVRLLVAEYVIRFMSIWIASGIVLGLRLAHLVAVYIRVIVKNIICHFVSVHRWCFLIVSTEYVAGTSTRWIYYSILVFKKIRKFSLKEKHKT
jgi:hypothetical protein